MDRTMPFKAAFELSNPRDRYCMKLQTTTTVFHVVENIVSPRMMGGANTLTSRPSMETRVTRPMVTDIVTVSVTAPSITNMDAFVTSTRISIETGSVKTSISPIT